MPKNKGRIDVPSQTCVPRQEKFPREIAANQTANTTARPLSDASSGFPGPVPVPTPKTAYEMMFDRGEFMYRSHTNGKKE